MTTEQTPDRFEQWAILELMGHRRLAGLVGEQTIAGAAFLRVDIPATEGTPAATQWYAPAAVYAITPCSEATARAAAAIGRVAPVAEWEIRPRITAPAAETDGPGEEDRLGYGEIEVPF